MGFRHYVHELDLTDEQTAKLRDWCAASRSAHNTAIAQREADNSLTSYDLANHYKVMRAAKPSYKAMPLQVLRLALKDVGDGFYWYSQGKRANKPTPRRVGENRTRLYNHNGYNVRQLVSGRTAIDVPALGPVKIKGEPIPGGMVGLTFYEKKGVWFARVTRRTR